MKVKDMVSFLSKYPEDADVEMVSVPDDNPMCDNIPIGKLVSIMDSDGALSICILPL